MKCDKCEYRMITTEIVSGKKIWQCANDKCNNKVVEPLSATEINNLVNELWDLKNKLSSATDGREIRALRSNIILIGRMLN